MKEVRTIVVTGATGFLGRHVLAEFANTSLRVRDSKILSARKATPGCKK